MSKIKTVNKQSEQIEIDSTTNDVYWSEFELVTPEKANYYLENNYPRNRPIQRVWVKALEEIMKTDKFEATSIQIAHCDNGIFLIDGQHRLMAIKNTQLAQNLYVCHRVFDNEEDLLRCYRRLDGGKKRTIGVALTNSPELADLTLEKLGLQAFSAAVKVIQNQFERTGWQGVQNIHSYDKRIDEMANWKNEAKIIDNILDKADPSMRPILKRSFVLALMLYTLKYQELRAKPFWEAVSTRTRGTKDSPVDRMIDFILKANVPNEAYMIQAVKQAAHIWNRYHKGEHQIQKMGPNIISKPIEILGTPLG